MPFHKRFQNGCHRLLSVAVFGSILVLILFFPSAGWLHAAGSPFEIELRELEREPAAVKKTLPAAAPGKEAGTPDKGTRREGDYVRYTLRPGDHIYKVLTMRFGLSSARAEALIPEIKRINGITDTSRLMIGQTILLPLPRKKRVVVHEPPPAAVSVSAPKPSPVPAPVEPAESDARASEPPKPASGPDRDMVRRAVAFWARLFPDSAADAVEAGARASDSAENPVLVGVGGREIRIVSPAGPRVFDNLSGAGGKIPETVVADPGQEKNFVLGLLRAAGFATTEGGAPLQFGTEAKLSIAADFTAAKLDPVVDVRRTILVLVGENGCPAVPDSLVSFLATKNLRLVAWCGESRAEPPYRAVQVVFMPSGAVAEMADAVLATLPVKVSRDHPIEIVVGQAGAPLSITVDRYFEREGKRCFIDFGEADQDRVTLFRLLELAGYRKIPVAAGDDLRTLADRFSEALGLPTEYRRRVLVSIPDRHYTLELPGILYRLADNDAATFFLADMPQDQPFFDLLKVVQWESEQLMNGPAAVR